MPSSRVFNLANFEQFTAINILVDPGAVGGAKIIPSVAEIDLVWTMAGARAAHIVLHGRYTGLFAGSVAQANAIHTGLTSGAAAVALFSHMGTVTNFNNVNIRDIAQSHQPLISSTASPVNGTGTGNTLPNEMALVVTKHTTLTGQANRGRMYVPNWIVSSVAADNTAIPAVVTDLQTWANTIQGVFNASGYTLVIAQPARNEYTGSTGTSHPARAATSITVSSLFVRDNHWDSQRRRGLK